MGNRDKFATQANSAIDDEKFNIYEQPTSEESTYYEFDNSENILPDGHNPFPTQSVRAIDKSDLSLGNTSKVGDTPEPTINDTLEKQNNQRVEAIGRFQEARKNNLSALQTIVNDSLKRREKLAEKKERNARSQAIANALGSLVNVFTAKAIADKGGYSPIISEYDKTAENVLRKSIEDRYALGNESENLLMKLEAERIGQENEFAKQIYNNEIAYIDAITKAQLAPLETAAALDLYKAKADIMTNAKNDQRTHAGEVQIGVNEAKHNNEGGGTGKKPKNEGEVLTQDEIAIAVRVNDGRQKISRSGGKSSRTPYSLNDDDRAAIIAELRAAKAAGLKDVDRWVDVYNELWKDDDLRKFVGNKDIRSVVLAAIKRGENTNNIIESIKEKTGVNNQEITK